MRKLVIIAALALPLAACQTNPVTQAIGTVLSGTLANPVQSHLGQVHAGYELYLETAAHYWTGEVAPGVPKPAILHDGRTVTGLPACRTPVREPCSHRNVVALLDRATLSASAAVQNLDAWTSQHPTINTGAVWDAAERAIAVGNQALGK